MHKKVCSHYIHSFISYGNTWASTNAKNLKKNKHVIRLVNNKEIFSHSRYLLRLGKILNGHQLNVLNFTTFIHRVQSKTIPKLSLSKFHKPQHKWPYVIIMSHTRLASLAKWLSVRLQNKWLWVLIPLL